VLAGAMNCDHPQDLAEAVVRRSAGEIV
jgi:hypothetical protein